VAERYAGNKNLTITTSAIVSMSSTWTVDSRGTDGGGPVGETATFTPLGMEVVS